MIRRIFATAALGGSLALGGATAAWAAPTTTAPSHFNCAKASKALSHIDKVESKDQAFVVKATSRETAATKAKHPKAAKLIQKRITAAQKREARATTRMQRIEAACPGSTATPSSSTTS